MFRKREHGIIWDIWKKVKDPLYDKILPDHQLICNKVLRFLLLRFDDHVYIRYIYYKYLDVQGVHSAVQKASSHEKKTCWSQTWGRVKLPSLILVLVKAQCLATFAVFLFSCFIYFGGNRTWKKLQRFCESVVSSTWVL